MILLEDIPRSGVFIVSAFFKGYKDNYQNDSRKDLKEKLPARVEGEDLDIDLEPLQFSLIRHVDETGRSRSIGVTYFYRFKDMNAKKYAELHRLARRFLESNAKWSHHQILIGSRVGGIENGE